jgi:hypothetical protein
VQIEKISCEATVILISEKFEIFKTEALT